MPRLTNSLPKYRKHKASRQAFVELNGRRVYLGPHGTQASKVEYDRLIAEWLLHGRKVQPGPKSAIFSVVELVVAYAYFAAGYYREDGRQTSEVEVIRLSVKLVKKLYGRRPCSEFGPTALKVVRQQNRTADAKFELLGRRRTKTELLQLLGSR